MMKVLLINCNPKAQSLCDYIIDKYSISYENTESKILNLKQLQFNYNFQENAIDENDIVIARGLIAKSDHIVFAFPLWWGSFPAIFKAFIDRIFISGFSYRYIKGKQIPQKLLTGKTASLAITMDSPVWYYMYFKGARAEKVLKDDILGFCGIRTTDVIRIGNVRSKSWDEISKEIDNKVNGSRRT
jgi:putative NADPH-quinone reductase